MKDLFYGIASFLLLLFTIVLMVFTFTESKVYEFSEKMTGKIIHKEDHNFFGEHVLVLINDSTITSVGCYDILYHNIEVGDSIVNGEIKKMKKDKDGL